MVTIRINKTVVEKFPDLQIAELYALYSHKGDRLRWTTRNNVTTAEALAEIELGKLSKESLTWFARVSEAPAGAIYLEWCQACKETTGWKDGQCTSIHPGDSVRIEGMQSNTDRRRTMVGKVESIDQHSAMVRCGGDIKNIRLVYCTRVSERT